jgi:hypothetical protein
LLLVVAGLVGMVVLAARVVLFKAHLHWYPVQTTP